MIKLTQTNTILGVLIENWLKKKGGGGFGS